jgi:hypothetical protein
MGVWCSACRDHGRAVQVDPIKPTLKPPGNKSLKLNSDEPLSSSGFECKLRRYTMDNPENQTRAGNNGAVVGRCRLTL